MRELNIRLVLLDVYLIDEQGLTWTVVYFSGSLASGCLVGSSQGMMLKSWEEETSSPPKQPRADTGPEWHG